MKPKLKVLVAAVVAAVTVAGVAAAASSPSVVTGHVSSVKQSSAVLHGTVNPNGKSTTYGFQWGLTTAYGAISRTRSAGSGTKVVPVKATATGLIPGTLYHYRLVADNGRGQTFGADHTFTTAGHPPPAVATGPSTEISTSAATVTGVVNPNGAATTYEFQYGTTTNPYPSNTTAQTLAAGKLPVTVSFRITGLASGTVFHYRIVALHGTTVSSVGADQVFMTHPAKRPKAGITARTKPGTDRSRPYSFTTSGTINHRNIPGTFGCNGQITVKYFSGRHRVGTFLIPLGGDCRFSGKNTFHKLPKRGRVDHRVHLKVEIRYGGNGYLAPVSAKNEAIALG